MTVIDPQTWADAEDGRALRELREALPSLSFMEILTPTVNEPAEPGMEWYLCLRGGDTETMDTVEFYADSFREAADAARAALVKR